VTRGHPNPYVRARADLPWLPPGDSDRSRAIPKTVWSLEKIHAIAQTQISQATASLILPITDKCTEDIQKLELSTNDLADRLLRLGKSNYDKSMWCRRSKQPGVKIAAEALWHPCDAYVLKVNEDIPSIRREIEIEYYFKLCLSSANKVVLLVSLHL